MPKKKQYVVPARLHYDVFRRGEMDEHGVDIEFVCSCATERWANGIARGLSIVWKFARGWSFVVRARPTEAHNTLKLYTNDERKNSEFFEDLEREYLTDEIAERVIAASVNGNGKPSPTVIKAVQKVLH